MCFVCMIERLHIHDYIYVCVANKRLVSPCICICVVLVNMLKIGMR